MTVELTKDPWPDCGSHAFSRFCDTMGGMAHGKHCYLYYHKGVFIGYDNGRWSVYVSSDPAAEWRRGCQNAACYANPHPTSKTAEFLWWCNAPEEVQIHIEPLILEAIAICAMLISNGLKAEAAEKEEKEQEKAQRKQDIVNAWKRPKDSDARIDD